MSDKFSIDSHKLNLHPIRVADWYKAQEEDNWERLKKIYPIYVEVSPYGGCNHRCTFCALDYMGYKHIGLDFDVLRSNITNMAENGVKSIMFAGEGEPLLFKDLDLIVEHAREKGIDTALTTNFVPLNKRKVQRLMENCSWIKVSLNAGTAESYADIHQTKAKDFDTVINNIRLAIEHREKNNLSCTLGVQMVLLPENAPDVVQFAKFCKELGVDYLVVKPYSQHKSSITTRYQNIDYSGMLELQRELERENTSDFEVVFRANTMKKSIEKKQSYEQCHATPFFWGYIAADGKVFGCSAYLGKDEFCYGDINKNTFSEIWEGDKRKESYRYVKNDLDIKNCRINCRMDEVNRYLDRLKNPQDHDNFI